jgi:hypothetical protein
VCSANDAAAAAETSALVSALYDGAEYGANVGNCGVSRAGNSADGPVPVTEWSELFGELTAAGLAKALDESRLNGRSAVRVVDGGAGPGKALVQMLLRAEQCYPLIESLTGFELCPSRFEASAQALRRLSTGTRHCPLFVGLMRR